MALDQEILKRINRHPSRSAGFKQLVRELGLRGGHERRELEDRLSRMVRRGELMEVGRDRYRLPTGAASKNLVAGRLLMHRQGYGFVLPDNKELKEKISGDIYVPPTEIGNAMHGDRVLVELGPIRRDGRAEGRIIKIADRAHATVVGTFHHGNRHNYIVPIDEKISQDVIIPPGAELMPEREDRDQDPIQAIRDNLCGRGARVETPHRVLGEEARRSTISDLEGVVVNVEITQFPNATQNARGRVVEVLGYEEDFGVDVEIIIRKHHLPHIFPDDALEEARAFPGEIPKSELLRRHDWRSFPIVTIDGETARDFDDAVLVTPLENGNYELQVHIADVAHYVREGTPIDREARTRGTSVYFPDRAIPMLPLELSTDLCSLLPQVDRLVLSCVMEIDHSGEIVHGELSEGIIRSAARMTYTNVQAILEGDSQLGKQHAPLVEGFLRMAELAAILNRKRVKRGSIDFDLPEPYIEFDEQGLMKGISRSERNTAHRLIEEFMLAANECVAAHLERKQVPSLYRIHEKPEARKVYDFETLAASFGYSLAVGALPVKRLQLKASKRSGFERNAEAIEIPQELHITPHMYQKLTDKIAGKPEERILSYLMLRSLKQARYSELNEGHFALASPSYTHFTSPIRRYPDLIVHRILKEVLAKQKSGERLDPESTSGDRSGAGIGARAHHAAASSQSKQHRRRSDGKLAKEKTSEAVVPVAPIPEQELHDIAEHCSMAERRADEAERELIEWKKMKFMADKVGEEFPALIISITKFGIFVELMDMFIEGLVPLSTLQGDRYTYRENTRQIIGERTKKQYALGDRVRVLLDRIDHAQRKLQFALIEPAPKQTYSRSPRTPRVG